MHFSESTTFFKLGNMNFKTQHMIIAFVLGLFVGGIALSLQYSTNLEAAVVNKADEHKDRLIKEGYDKGFADAMNRQESKDFFWEDGVAWGLLAAMDGHPGENHNELILRAYAMKAKARERTLKQTDSISSILAQKPGRPQKPGA